MTESSGPEQELGDLLFGRGIYTRPEAPEVGLLPRIAPFLPAQAVGTALLAALAIPDESVRLSTLFQLGQRLRVTSALVQDDPRLHSLRQADRDALAGRSRHRHRRSPESPTIASISCLRLPRHRTLHRRSPGGRQSMWSSESTSTWASPGGITTSSTGCRIASWSAAGTRTG